MATLTTRQFVALAAVCGACCLLGSAIGTRAGVVQADAPKTKPILQSTGEPLEIEVPEGGIQWVSKGKTLMFLRQQKMTGVVYFSPVEPLEARLDALESKDKDHAERLQKVERPHSHDYVIPHVSFRGMDYPRWFSTGPGHREGLKETASCPTASSDESWPSASSCSWKFR
jgi:hypothetical protein